MNILGRVPKTKQDSQCLVLMTDRYTNETKAIPSTKHNATTVPRIFLEHLVANYVIPSRLLPDDGSQFASKFLAAVCSTFGVINITATEYHPQTNDQVERSTPM